MLKSRITDMGSKVEPTGRKDHSFCLNDLISLEIFITDFGYPAILNQDIFFFFMEWRVTVEDFGGLDEYLHFKNRIRRISTKRKQSARISAYFHNGFPKYLAFISLLKASSEFASKILMV